MEKVKSSSSININIHLTLNEIEARALEAIAGYGSTEFLRVFYEKLGISYLKPHEDGIISIFENISKELPKHIQKAEDTRNIWNK
jgi:hypothetical protein